MNISGNWSRCTSCHIGYGWEDANFDFSDKTRIDCLVCHDTTGTYKKAPPGAGYPAKGVDLVKVAKSVGKPSRATCGGACHFRGGGGDGVKHASLSSSMLEPKRECDVHMGVDSEGMNFRCQDCHKTRNHLIAGRAITTPVSEGDISCQYCHTDKPHVGGKNLLVYHLNRHTKHVACQTCHIPLYAKCKPTKVYWDWSTAGSKKVKVKKGKYGKPIYQKKKGDMAWAMGAKPKYQWYNGTVKHLLLGQKINDNGVTEINTPIGGIADPSSRIYPFKVFRGKQISDAVYKYLIPPKLWKGYWSHWDWDKAAREGAKAAGIAYSGSYEFVETITYWAVTHGVYPKEQALSCAHCHPTLTKEPYCGRCHQQREGVDFEALAKKGIDFTQLAKKLKEAEAYVGKTDFIDFKALGYKGDPIEVGGRFGILKFGGLEK